ncbi:MAG TPA: hypothetical protein VMS17_33915, partial [Gemmataceae bacterium]|nr:hypothetical protein [Gemmataceae bacterium]
MRFCATTLAAAAVLLAVGCNGPKPPATYTAIGKAVYADGAALAGGTLQFQPEAAGAPSAFAEVDKDGRFTLLTIVDGKRINGAVEGNFHVTYIPPVGADQKGGLPVVLPDVYTVLA